MLATDNYIVYNIISQNIKPNKAFESDNLQSFWFFTQQIYIGNRMKIFYKTPMATSTGGRAGHVALDDGSLGFDLQTLSGKQKFHN